MENFQLPFNASTLTLLETQQIAQSYLQYFFKQKIICPILLSGKIGTGKSTFVKFCLSYLSLLSENQIYSSPSFSIINEYTIPKKNTQMWKAIKKECLLVYHIDLYRIQSIKEVENLGFFEILQEHICFVEWPERIQWKIPNPYYKIYIDIVSETERSMNIALITDNTVTL